MRQTLSFLTLLILFMSNAQAQKVYNYPRPGKRHMCATTIVGISSLTVGVGAAIGGLAMEWSAGVSVEHSGNLNQNPAAAEQYQHDENTALAVRDVGLVLLWRGLV